jgi:hypothetical protein
MARGSSSFCRSGLPKPRWTTKRSPLGAIHQQLRLQLRFAQAARAEYPTGINTQLNVNLLCRRAAYRYMEAAITAAIASLTKEFSNGLENTEDS